jgi:hypothetical protein
LADDPKRRATAKPAAAKPATAAPVRKPLEDEDANPYQIVRETEEELREAERTKPKYQDIADKFKKSMRGPASAALVMPTKLLIAVGVLTCIISLVWFIVGLWPLVFTDAPASDEEIVEALIQMFLAVLVFVVGILICYGAFMMQNLESYTWAIIASCITIPLLVGIYSLITLRDPRVIAGFQEVEGATDDDDDDLADDDDDDDDDE